LKTRLMRGEKFLDGTWPAGEVIPSSYSRSD
jgi:hypothetical protein